MATEGTTERSVSCEIALSCEDGGSGGGFEDGPETFGCVLVVVRGEGADYVVEGGFNV